MSDNRLEPQPSEAEQDLNLLWQQQHTDIVGIDGIKQKWLQIKYKQRCYLLFDITSMLVLLSMVYFMFDKLGVFAKGWMVALSLMTVATTGYLSYLRRFALNWSNVCTDSYIEQLRKQLSNNIRIARLNRNLALWMIVAIAVFYAGMAVFDGEAFDSVLRRWMISMVILAIFTPPYWLWAHRRALRFSRELSALEHGLQQHRS